MKRNWSWRKINRRLSMGGKEIIRRQQNKNIEEKKAEEKNETVRSWRWKRSTRIKRSRRKKRTRRKTSRSRQVRRSRGGEGG